MSRDVGARWGVRSRLTVLACILVLLPLLAAGSAVAVMLHQVLSNSLVSRLSEDARMLADTVSADGPSAIDLRHLGPDVHGLGIGPDPHGLSIRVEDGEGRLVFGWPEEGSLPDIDHDLANGEVRIEGVSPVPTPGSGEIPVTVTMGTEYVGTRYVVAVSAPQRTQQQAVASVVSILLAGMPLVILVTALVAWVTVGRALRPVDRMRAAADDISTGALASRLPTPRHDDELGRLARTLNDMLSRLQAGHEAQRRFVADASHELRSPLTSLRAAVQLGREDGSAETWNSLGPVMETESARLHHLVEDLLTLSKADEQGVMPISRDEVDLDDLVFAERARLRGAEVEVGGAITPVRILGDERALARALRNLADNAVRAARAQVAISVTSDPDASLAYLVVEDDGLGVPQDQRERIFERFVRLDEARHRDSGGSGLGLAIVA
ncbi:MAG: ATP-binding protein, partial [Mobilicoccus sp.]|nr:ATP-binding protein [Mobilicoccus sp.]